LETWYARFRDTQAGVIPFSFRWNGRSENHTLTSGLDDYPRLPGQPSESELHLDLHCWMTKFTLVIKAVAETLGDQEKARLYNLEAQDMLRVLEDLHWDPEKKAYSDVLFPSFRIHHAGYVSLFPFLLGLVPPDSDKIPHILQAMKDPQLMWSNYGLRSLALSDPYFGKDENYWRGPIWVNVNYLALSSLYNNFVRDGSPASPYKKQAKELYSELRTNLISNIFRNYQSTGYVFEQYHPLNGKGQRSHPFTGWTSLVVAIMAELY